MLDHRPTHGETVDVFTDPLTEKHKEDIGIVIAETDVPDQIVGIAPNGKSRQMQGYFLVEMPPEPQTSYRFISWLEKVTHASAG